jgi:hypothetical protein
MRYTLLLSLLSATIFALEQQAAALPEGAARIEADSMSYWLRVVN